MPDTGLRFSHNSTMMKHLKISFALLSLLTVFSCRKIIDIKETDVIAGETALKTVENNESAIVGAYSGMNVEMPILLNATFSDEVKKSPEFYNAATTHEWQYGSQDVTIRDNFTAMSPYYTVIDRVNRILETVLKSDSTRPQDNNALRERLKGEALFMRAYSHFELYRFYCGDYTPGGLAMPYMEKPNIGPQSRIDMATYFNKLKADMAEAKPLVPNNMTDIYRANKFAVAALQARVALYMKDWANAEIYASEVIAAAPLATRSVFPSIWTDAVNNEVVFKLKKTAAVGGRLGSLFRGTSASPSNIGTVSWIPSDELWNSYDQTNDIRFSTYLRDEPTLAAAGRQTHLIKKYEGTGFGTTNENVADAKVFRTAEMYLIRAEARAELGRHTGTNSAENDINELRLARITGYVPMTFTSKDQAIDEIILERFKELPYEGHRFWDLRRRNLPVTRTGADVPTPNAATLPAGNFRFLLPIPDAEVKANPKIQQNPGY
jgi:starch-binding outer membrane protein, SusD/RagB family